MGCVRNFNGQMIIGVDIPMRPRPSNEVVSSLVVHLHLHSHFFYASEEQHPLFLKYHASPSQHCFFLSIWWLHLLTINPPQCRIFIESRKDCRNHHKYSYMLGLINLIGCVSIIGIHGPNILLLGGNEFDHFLIVVFRSCLIKRSVNWHEGFEIVRFEGARVEWRYHFFY